MKIIANPTIPARVVPGITRISRRRKATPRKINMIINNQDMSVLIKNRDLLANFGFHKL
jgi:hypothetical protein